MSKFFAAAAVMAAIALPAQSSAQAGAQPLLTTAVRDALLEARDTERLALDPDMFVSQIFVSRDNASVEALPSGAVMAAYGQCPPGWRPYLHKDDGEPLYFTLGLLVDKDRNPRVEDYSLLPACEKQRRRRTGR